MKKVIIFIALLILPTLTFAQDSIVIAPGKYFDYYHVKYTLTPENCELAVSDQERPLKTPYISNKYEFYDDGMFEVFVDKKDFPAVTHFNKKYLILRMPGGDPEDVAAKRKLFEAIKTMKEFRKGSVEVVVELGTSNFGTKVVSRKPLVIEIEGRNIFFRDSHGKYIDYLGPLKEKD